MALSKEDEEVLEKGLKTIKYFVRLGNTSNADLHSALGRIDSLLKPFLYKAAWSRVNLSIMPTDAAALLQSIVENVLTGFYFERLPSSFVYVDGRSTISFLCRWVSNEVHELNEVACQEVSIEKLQEVNAEDPRFAGVDPTIEEYNWPRLPVEALLNILPEDEAGIMRLTIYEDLQPREIAALRYMDTAEVSQLKRNAVRTLRNHVTWKDGSWAITWQKKPRGRRPKSG